MRGAGPAAASSDALRAPPHTMAEADGMTGSAGRLGYITRVQSFSACHRLHRWVSVLTGTCCGARLVVVDEPVTGGRETTVGICDCVRRL